MISAVKHFVVVKFHDNAMGLVDERKLDEFSEWLREYGRSEGTVTLYVRDLRGAFATGGPLKRLLDDKLAPKTRRHILAACRAWAKFCDDEVLRKRLDRLRLPPAERATEKVPLEREQWHALINYLDSGAISCPMRAQLGIMTCRGLRVSDVLRMTRTQVDRALKTGTLTHTAKGRRNLQFRVLDTYRRYLDVLAEEQRWTVVADLLCSRRSKRPAEAAKRAVARALDRCGVAIGLDPGELYPHRLRRTYAVQYLAELGSAPDALVRLQQHMGWKSLATAMAYVDHARGSELDDVAERMLRR